MRKSVEILQEAIKVQEKKGSDYQNPASTIRQADYYPNGIQTIYDTMHGKMLRIKSVMETMQANPNAEPNYESLEDSCIDLINYASFFAAYLEHGIDGQDIDRNVFNKPEQKYTSPRFDTVNMTS